MLNLTSLRVSAGFTLIELMISVAITAQIAVALGLMHIIFTMRVGGYRLKNEISLGDGGDKQLLKRIRAHANFTETVPIALILILLNELNAASTAILYALAGTLIVARLMHYVSIAFKTPLLVRVVGMTATLLVIAGSSILLLI